MAFKFIDLCAGIGGMRLAAERNGGKCVLSSEIDAETAAAYRLNHGDEPVGDLMSLNPDAVPDSDMLLAGFPCQPFSKAGKLRGFADPRGTVFGGIMNVVRAKKPALVILENVKNLSRHDGGATLETVMGSLADAGYAAAWKVLDARSFGLAQSRERTIIVASLNGAFRFAKTDATAPPMSAILEDGGDFEFLGGGFTLIPKPAAQPKSGLIFAGYVNKNMRTDVDSPNPDISRSHKQHNRVYSAAGSCPTIAAHEPTGRRWILLEDGRVRKLTLR